MLRYMPKERADKLVKSGQYRYLTNEERSVLSKLGLDLDGDIVSIFPMLPNVNYVSIYPLVRHMLGKTVFLWVEESNGIISI